MDPSSGKYSTVGDCEAVGPAVGLKRVPLACEGGINSEDPFPKYSLVGEGPIVVVLTGVFVMNLDTTLVGKGWLVGLAKPDPVGLKPREGPEPSGSV